ncbi:MAG: FAD-dependent oxidoreductase [Rubrivivax sp.]|nr:FAD-dependent oxidoreductase [Rubrivivax sp.]
MQTYDTDVLIAGGGPVGLTGAMDLAQRGVRVTLAEVRRYAEPPNVKCNHVSARSMEIFRRLGLAQALRDAGLPADHPNDVVFRTSVTGHELTRIPIPCRRDRYTDTSGPDGWWPTPEPPHRINQTYLEPVLLHHAAARPGIRLHHRTQLTGFEQDAHGVTAELLDLDTNKTRRIRARYLLGCDGGSSMVRKAIGAKLEGTPVIQRVQSSCIRAPGLRALETNPPAWCCYSVNPRRCGTVFAIDGREIWLVHNHLNPGEDDFDAVDRDWAIRQILGVDERFEYEVLTREDWVGRRLVADRFRQGRVFIAGDAAHLWVPYAGYGMNAGIADVTNLTWLLAGVIQGWAGERFLDAYEAERQPITQQVSHFAMDHAAKMIKARSAVPPNIEADDAAGAAERARIGAEAYALNVQQFCCGGLNFGYYYEGSPIVIRDREVDGTPAGAEAEAETPPPYTMDRFTESTVPGCRVPHVWLADGRSLFDAFGPGYTLIRRDRRVDVSGLVEAARAQRVPLVVLDAEPRDGWPEAYRHALVLCRADTHVAWRGDGVPKDSGALIANLRGAVNPQPFER